MAEQDLSQIDPEIIAQWLEQTGNFKVLRRITERTDFGGTVKNPVKIMLLDTETTGLDFHQSELIELGALVLEADREIGAIGRVLGTFEGLEDPGFPIPPESTAIHGITDDMVSKQSFNEEAFHRLCHGVELFVAHNAGFDKPFVVRRFPWLTEQGIWVCSFRELPLAQEGYKSKGLQALLTEAGYFYGAHRALEDCLALAYFLVQPLKDSQRLPVAVLFESASQAIYEIVALQSPFEKKDQLKSRGFRWNSAEKQWEYTALGFAEGKEVIEWLRQHIYGVSDKIRLGFRVRNGKDRYAGSAVALQIKDV
ncbi:MAG: DNA polymerase III subunit epsilon [Limnobacter sp.]|nr:DNA polymerase III subunit epsilon [Limnobacter sp.]